MLLSDVWRLSVWRLSVSYIGPKSRTERPRKTVAVVPRRPPVWSPTVCPNWLWPLPTVNQPSLDTPCRHVRPPTSLPTRVLSRISYQWGVPCKQEPGGPFPPSLPTPSTLPSLLFPLPSPFPLPFPSLPLPLEVGPLNPARGSGGAL